MSLSFSRYAASFSMYVAFFRCQSFPDISRRADWFPCPLFPFHSPLHSSCFHVCPFHVPFSSPLFPFHFPLLSGQVDFLFPPLISLQILAFPLFSPIFPSVFAKRTSTNTEFFSTFSATGGKKPKPAKSRQGDSSLGPLLCDTGSPKTTFSGTSYYCAVRGPPPPAPKPYISGRGGGGLGGLSSILSSVSDTPPQCRRI